eukprot:1176582-Prorocentrum_minimum.AAC.1
MLVALRHPSSFARVRHRIVRTSNTYTVPATDADPSDAGSAGIFSRRTRHGVLRRASRWSNQTQKARVYSHDGPIRRRKRGHILTTDQSDTGSAGIFSRRTNQIQEARAYSHDGPIEQRRRTRAPPVRRLSPPFCVR